MRIDPRIGVADSGHFDGFRLPLSSAPFYICLVIRHFSKTAEDRSSADTGVPLRYPRHLRHLAPMHLRNVLAYILLDCPRGIFVDGHYTFLIIFQAVLFVYDACSWMILCPGRIIHSFLRI